MSSHETLGDAWVSIRGDGAKFPSDIKGVVERGLSDTAKKGAEILGGMFIGAKFTQAAKAGLEELKNAAAVQAQTVAAIASTGGASGTTADQIDALSKSLEHLSGTDDEIIKQGQNVLLSFQEVQDKAGQGNDIFDRATKAGLDLATRGFGSVEGNAKLLGIALSDPEKGLTRLRRAGVVLTEQQIASIKGFQATGDLLDAQKVLLDAVEAKVGGAAKAYGETLPGKLAIAHESLKDTEAQLVSGAAPALELFAGWVTAATDAVTKLPGPLQTVISVAATATVGFVAIARPLGAVIQLYDRFLGSSQAATAATEEQAAATVTAAEAETVAVTETTTAMSAAEIAQLKRITSNEALTFSDAEVAAALQARQAAELQLLVGQDALIASDAELVAADQARAAAAAEVAAASNAEAASLAGLDAAGIGLGGVLATAAAGGLIAVGVFGALKEAFSTNEIGVADYTAAIEKNTGALAENVDASTAAQIEQSGVADIARDAGVQFGTLFDAVRTGTDDWGSYYRAIVNIPEAQAQGTQGAHAMAAALRDAGAGSTVFGQQLIAGVEAGRISQGQAEKLLHSMEGLHNGYLGATEAARKHKEITDAVTGSTQAATGAYNLSAAALDELDSAISGVTGLENDLAGAMDKTYQATIASTKSSIAYNAAIDDLAKQFSGDGSVTAGNAKLAQSSDAVQLAQDRAATAQARLDAVRQNSKSTAIQIASAENAVEAANLAVEHAQSSNAAAQDKLNASTAQGTFTLDANTEAGRKNLSLALAAGESISKLIELQFQQSHSLEQAQAAGALYVQNLHDQLRAAGATEDQIAQLIATMHLTPTDIKTEFSNNAVEQQIVIQKYLDLLKDPTLTADIKKNIEAEIELGNLDVVNQQLNDLAAGVAVNFAVILDPSANHTFAPSAGGRKAAGGPVYAGEMYQVNEQGREFFAPAVDGTILSADRVEAALRSPVLAGIASGWQGGRHDGITVQGNLVGQLVSPSPELTPVIISRGLRAAAFRLGR